MVWFHYFFGTPRRFVVTISVLVVIIFPGPVETAILCLTNALMHVAVIGLIIYLGYRIIVKGK
jgi:hypothetical protein